MDAFEGHDIASIAVGSSSSAAITSASYVVDNGAGSHRELLQRKASSSCGERTIAASSASAARRTWTCLQWKVFRHWSRISANIVWPESRAPIDTWSPALVRHLLVCFVACRSMPECVGGVGRRWPHLRLGRSAMDDALRNQAFALGKRADCRRRRLQQPQRRCDRVRTPLNVGIQHGLSRSRRLGHGPGADACRSIRRQTRARHLR